MLKVIAAHRPPLVIVEEAAAASERPIFKGFLVDLLPTLLQTAELPVSYSISLYNVSAHPTAN